MPEYYKTNKGYYYKITKKGPNKGKKRISKETYEKSIDKKEGSGFLSSPSGVIFSPRKNRKERKEERERERERKREREEREREEKMYNNYKNEKILKKYWLRYVDNGEKYKRYINKDYRWCDDFYKSSKLKYNKYLRGNFNKILNDNLNNNVRRTSESTQDMIFNYYMKIIYDIVNKYQFTEVYYIEDKDFEDLKKNINEKLKEDSFFKDYNYHNSLRINDKNKRELLDIIDMFLRSDRIDDSKEPNKCEI